MLRWRAPLFLGGRLSFSSSLLADFARHCLILREPGQFRDGHETTAARAQFLNQARQRFEGL